MKCVTRPSGRVTPCDKAIFMPRVCCCLLAALLFWLPTTTVWPLPATSLPPVDTPAPADASGKEAATAEISGSRRPGVIEHLLQRPLPDTPAKHGGKAEISINYPSVGNADIDADIRQWVTGIADAFEAHLDISVSDLSAPGGGHTNPAFQLLGSYSLTRPSDAAVSITFEIWNYTGGAGNLDIMTLNYSLITGQRLGLVDLFEAPETALNLMSAWSRQELARRFGGRLTQMLKDGAAPLVENFSSLTLTPEGIRINFQPYQVAPAAAGAQKVDMPLEELLQARPLLTLWNRQEN